MIDFMTTAEEQFARYREMDRDELENQLQLRDIVLHQKQQEIGFLKDHVRALERKLADA
jgi:hypothetical protein